MFVMDKFKNYLIDFKKDSTYKKLYYQRVIRANHRITRKKLFPKQINCYRSLYYDTIHSGSKTN